MQHKPLIPWMGGKRRLAKQILPMFPEHRCYVEPFAGGAALFFLKAPSKVEVINDINGDLINLYRVVQHHLEPLITQFKWCLVSRDEFARQLMVPPETLTDIQRAARFLYLQKTAFGARPTGQTFGYAPSSPPRFNLLRIEEELSQAHIRLARCYVENLPWQTVVEKYDRNETLFYLDPPYWQTEGYGVEFGLEEYQRIAELGESIKGKMIISVNDHPDMRKVFRKLEITTTKLRYTVGKTTTEPKGELIIRNWE